MARLGFVVNPVAGLGGKPALKGSDAPETRRLAAEHGVPAPAPVRAVEALVPVARSGGIDVVAYAGEMGADAARAAGIEPTVVGEIEHGATTAADTHRAVLELEAAGVDLLLFVGGDGTAADVHRAVGGRLPVLGVPSGVKMYSAVFALTPAAAGRLTVLFLTGEVAGVREAEVMDVDEAELGRGVVSARLLGVATVPAERRLVQHLKARSAGSERAALAWIADDVAELLEPGVLVAFGPGTTTASILERIGAESTLLGVDVLDGHELVAQDVDERRLLELVVDRPARVVVTPVGGQGFLFGRGNQQISAAVLRRLGRANVVPVATEHKLRSLGGRPFYVDTGDEEVDALLTGYLPVVTGYRRRAVYRVAAPR